MFTATNGTKVHTRTVILDFIEIQTMLNVAARRLQCLLYAYNCSNDA